MQTYRIVAMLPTEMYIEVENISQAQQTMKWLGTQYPSIDIDGNEPAVVKFLCLEYIKGDPDLPEDDSPTNAAQEYNDVLQYWI